MSIRRSIRDLVAHALYCKSISHLLVRIDCTSAISSVACYILRRSLSASPNLVSSPCQSALEEGSTCLILSHRHRRDFNVALSSCEAQPKALISNRSHFPTSVFRRHRTLVMHTDLPCKTRAGKSRTTFKFGRSRSLSFGVAVSRLVAVMVSVSQ